MKKNKKDILIIGAYPPKGAKQHPGGQITATKQLINYAKKHNILYDIIDTTQNSFPRPSKYKKSIDAFIRIKLILFFLKKNTYKGALVFSSDGLGFFEKILLSIILETKKVPTMFFMRSGYFIEQVENSKIFKNIAKYLLSKMTFIAHQGGVWNNFYKKLGIENKKLYKILNWIETPTENELLANSKKDSSIVFLYVGWLIKEKGVLDLLEVIYENKSLNTYKFVFVGSGTLLTYMQDYIDSKGMHNVILKGWLNKEEVEQEYKNSDVFIFPSYAEGFPNVILEALKYKLPIISTNVGGISESVINNYNGLLINPMDKKAILKSINKLANKNKRLEFTNNIDSILYKNHNIEVNCKKLFEVFNISSKGKK